MEHSKRGQDLRRWFTPLDKLAVKLREKIGAVAMSSEP
jgi:hypothetical protein